MNVNITINENAVAEQPPKPEHVTMNTDELMRAMDMTLMSFEQKVGERAAEGGEVTLADIVDVLQGMFRDAVEELKEIENEENKEGKECR